ncbi:MAG: DUF86 domain-containing protein [Candidatus Nanohaloarchaea archaeon]|nr:DUF86 domain-containing protein [Candidatus Nanohaloarchaea archaeon]
MNVDTERINDKIDQLHSYLSQLEEDLPETAEEYVRNRTTRRACEKDFELACDTLIDICNIIISGFNNGRPRDNRESIQSLVKEDIIPQTLGNRLKDMNGFRNLLIHRYGKIDHEQAFVHLESETGDFQEFIEHIDSFLEEIGE